MLSWSEFGTDEPPETDEDYGRSIPDLGAGLVESKFRWLEVAVPKRESAFVTRGVKCDAAQINKYFVRRSSALRNPARSKNGGESGRLGSLNARVASFRRSE